MTAMHKTSRLDVLSPAAVVARAEAAARRTALEDELALQLRAAGIAFEREAPFWPGRGWRLDFALQHHRIAIEVQGGIWRAKGAHNTGGAITRDAEKACHAAMLGWRVMPVTGDQIRKGLALQWVKAAMGVQC